MRSDEILKRAEEGMKASNKILIKELVRDLEENGISPVIAVDGEPKKLNRIVDKNELEDFENELKKFGLEKSDFCLLEEDNTEKKPSTFYVPEGQVIVIHKKSAKIRKYRAGGRGTHWVTDFHHDLQNRLFN